MLLRHTLVNQQLDRQFGRAAGSKHRVQQQQLLILQVIRQLANKQSRLLCGFVALDQKIAFADASGDLVKG